MGNDAPIYVIRNEKTRETLPHMSIVPVPVIVIPRPSLLKEHSECWSGRKQLVPAYRAFPSDNRKRSPDSSNCSSKTSTQSVNSGTLLLTAANLAAYHFDQSAQPHHGYITKKLSYDAESLASSTHFTLVNGMERKLKSKKPVDCCCERHQLKVLITCMTLFLAALVFFCIYFVRPHVDDKTFS